ncbi:beta-L-arabinofuranosidase domain-containing protein [Ruminiclostridium josui]|uniref:beta-L-arabinofuranosidase domain-containing protein n=1 Tax=Ruminiclostridium josui TaxID=1499 RepID=UPI00046584C5|nr:beta-L-arabinofuranosidase domain-containing protein [Ruminiclostridium josui]
MSKIPKEFICSSIFYMLVLLLLAFLTPSIVYAESVDKLQPFDMEQVNVTDPYLVNAFNKEISYLQSIDPNRLLVGYKQTAGLSTSYSKYGGWESTPLEGHTLGHYMSALAQAYKNTKSNSTVNADIKKRIDLIISELQACQNKRGDGYIYAESPAQFNVVEGKATGTLWAPWYTMHKIMAGLISIYQLEGNPTALTVASKLGDWIYNRVNAWDSATQAKVLSVEYGGMNDCLLELYKLTGKSNHLAAAKKFEEPSLLNTIASGNNVLPGKHANTIIPKFIGAINRYRTLGTSETSYLTAAQQFWNFVVRDHTYVTGGNSQWEAFRAAGKLDQYRDEVNNETCNSYNMLKLTRELFQVTGDVKYADFYERAFINEILASQNPETGMTTYFKPMGTGYFKVFSKPFDNFWCCTGTGMENFTKLNDSIYFNNGTDLYINMYISSTLNWSEKGLSLTQKADVPLSDTVTFTIDSAPSSEVRLKFRSPYWVATGKKVTVKVNGSSVNVSAVNGYLDVSRVWKVEDKIELTIPAEVQTSRCTDNQSVAAFTYGPVVLCAGLGSESMTTSSVGWNVTTATKTVNVRDTININSSTSASLDDWLGNINKYLVQTPGKLEFTFKETDCDNSLVFTPYYKHYTGRYGIYFTLKGSFTGPRNPFTKIEAESYNAQSGIQDVTCDEGTSAIGYIENGDYAVYKNMDFDSRAIEFVARTSSAQNDGKIEIRLDSITGPLVGTCKVTSTGGWQIFTDSKCSVSDVTGKHDIYLKFVGDSGYLFNINWFKFIKEDVSTVLAGDLNGDNTIDATDFAMMKMYLLGLINDLPAQNDIEAGDLNKDGVINALDFAVFKKYLLGSIENLPYTN